MNASEAKVITNLSSSPPLTGRKPSWRERSVRVSENQFPGFVVLLLTVTCARIIIQIFSPLDLSPDEAHYWEWSRKLDWSYYSKGPVVAWLIALSTSFWGDTQWGVRFPALVHSVALLTGLYWFLAANLDKRVAFCSVALLHSGVYFFSLGLGMTTDAPCLFGWFLTLAFAYKAVFQEEISHSWKWAGACAGFAALSKYTAVFIFPSILFTFLVVPSLRPQLYRVRFWQGWGISLMALLPVFVWNFNNGWVNLLHNSNHLIPQQPGQLRAGNILEVLAACVFMTGPILLGVLAHFICTYIRNRETASYHETMAAKVHFFLIPGLGLLGVCLVVALQKRVYPNWIAPVFLYFTIAAAFAWRHTDRRLEHYGTWIKYGLALNCIVLIIGTSGVLGFTWGIPSSRLPVRKLIGWRELGMTVGSLTRNLGTTSVPIVTDSYELASELAFYTPNHPVVYCARVGERRMNQYDIWGGWEKLAGKAVLLVLRTDRVPQTLGEHFQDIRSLSTPFSVIHQHETLRTFYFFIGTDYDGSRPKDGTFF